MQETRKVGEPNKVLCFNSEGQPRTKHEEKTMSSAAGRRKHGDG